MYHTGRYTCRSAFCLFLKVIKCLYRNTFRNGEVKHSSQFSRNCYSITLPHASMKLHRVHMAARGNATIIFLVALLRIWLTSRSKIHTDINLNNKQLHFTLFKWLRIGKVYTIKKRKRSNLVSPPKWIFSSSAKAKKHCLLQKIYATDRW